MNLFDELRLPNGASIRNRIAKAVMEENMADDDQAPSERMMRLYGAWADGGAGLINSGNVMISGTAMTGPGGVVLEDGTSLDRFRRWAAIGKRGGARSWLQLNHPGRQMPANLGQQAVGPSAIALDMGAFSKMFGVPVAMTEPQIEDVVQRFATSARLAEEAGFDGVEIHAAHGYLISQFLSPLSNRREDRCQCLDGSPSSFVARQGPFCISLTHGSGGCMRRVGPRRRQRRSSERRRMTAVSAICRSAPNTTVRSGQPRTALSRARPAVARASWSRTCCLTFEP